MLKKTREPGAIDINSAVILSSSVIDRDIFPINPIDMRRRFPGFSAICRAIHEHIVHFRFYRRLQVNGVRLAARAETASWIAGTHGSAIHEKAWSPIGPAVVREIGDSV